MKAARQSVTVVKVSINEAVDPGLYRAIEEVPARARSRRLISLARLGILVEQGRLHQGARLVDGADSEPGDMEVAANGRSHPGTQPAIDPSLLGEGLDDLLTNIGGPLKS